MVYIIHVSTRSISPHDHIYPITRVLGAFIIPFLTLAVLILYFFPDQTGERFAWPVKPPLTAMLMAAAYAGGVYFFSWVVAARRWLSVKQGFLPVITFATILGVATILHWNKFTHGHIAFILWAGLYFSTPFLVFGAWLHNRKVETPDQRQAGSILPIGWRLFFGLQAASTLLPAVVLFLAPSLVIPVWPWQLTPLTARVMGAMFAIPGVLGIEIVLDPRWEASRRLLEAQFISFFLILVALLRSRADFGDMGTVYAGFIAAVSVILLMLVLLFIQMRNRSRRVPGQDIENQADFSIK